MTGSLTSNIRFDASLWRVAIVAARFNAPLVDQLVDGATRAWTEQGGRGDALIVTRVPGAFELPLAARAFAASGKFQAVIALGCVIRGDTPHFDYVAGECARGLMDAGLATGVPVIFGVLTTENQGQAEERASVARMNKGGESLLAALEMIVLLRPFTSPASGRPKPHARDTTKARAARLPSRARSTRAGRR
jgi:6,7-dimethyl-8-ribityllumazine synthase